MDRTKIACRCHNITYGRIADAVKDGAKTLEEVAALTGCGTGCGKCRDFLSYFIAELCREEEKKYEILENERCRQ